ncbi:MAG: polyprenyl synthetase family protein [Myxococcales bacterium]|nr:polyprenyl synthetase family protein [Myxococcales bacterium]
MTTESRWLADLVARVDAHLAAFFDARLAQAEATSPEARALVAAVAELTLRGGKRLRPAALYAGYAAVDPSADLARVLEPAAALELLQSYLLIQDDWMDGDERRRGGPSVHAAFAAEHGDAHLGASLAILAGDLASGFAWELIARADFPKARAAEALELFGRTHFEVLCGQQLDLLHHPDVALVHQLKTGSYTVRGPLLLGALLGDASEAQLSALQRFGEPLGLAFQLRDDLLGAFGDGGAVGKPIGNDLRAGKLTALVMEARERMSEAQRSRFEVAFGRADASDAAVQDATDALLASGARERVEARLDGLLASSRLALADAELSARGKEMLEQLLLRIAKRQS